MARRKNTAEAFEILYRLAEERKTAPNQATASTNSRSSVTHDTGAFDSEAAALHGQSADGLRSGGPRTDGDPSDGPPAARPGEVIGRGWLASPCREPLLRRPPPESPAAVPTGLSGRTRFSGGRVSSGRGPALPPARGSQGDTRRDPSGFARDPSWRRVAEGSLLSRWLSAPMGYVAGQEYHPAEGTSRRNEHDATSPEEFRVQAFEAATFEDRAFEDGGFESAVPDGPANRVPGATDASFRGEPRFGAGLEEVSSPLATGEAMAAAQETQAGDGSAGIGGAGTDGGGIFGPVDFEPREPPGANRHQTLLAQAGGGGATQDRHPPRGRRPKRRSGDDSQRSRAGGRSRGESSGKLPAGEPREERNVAGTPMQIEASAAPAHDARPNVDTMSGGGGQSARVTEGQPSEGGPTVGRSAEGEWTDGYRTDGATAENGSAVAQDGKQETGGWRLFGERVLGGVFGVGGSRFLAKRVELRIATLLVLLLGTVVVTFLLAAATVLPSYRQPTMAQRPHWPQETEETLEEGALATTPAEGSPAEGRSTAADLPPRRLDETKSTQAPPAVGRPLDELSTPGADAARRGRKRFRRLPRKLAIWAPAGGGGVHARRDATAHGARSPGEGGYSSRVASGPRFVEQTVPAGFSEEPGRDVSHGAVREGGVPAPPRSTPGFRVRVRSDANDREAQSFAAYFQERLGYGCKTKAQEKHSASGEMLYIVYLAKHFDTREAADRACQEVWRLAAKDPYRSGYFADARVVQERAK